MRRFVLDFFWGGGMALGEGGGNVFAGGVCRGWE